RDYMALLASVVARTAKTGGVQAVSARWSSGMHSAARIAAGMFISAMRRPMPKDFENKVALVTGASRGIGRAAAVRLAEGGAKVAIGYAGNDAAAKEAKAEAEKAGAPAVLLLKFDVASPEAAVKAIDDTMEKLGGLHV